MKSGAKLLIMCEICKYLDFFFAEIFFNRLLVDVEIHMDNDRSSPSIKKRLGFSFLSIVPCQRGIAIMTIGLRFDAQVIDLRQPLDDYFVTNLHKKYYHI